MTTATAKWFSATICFTGRLQLCFRLRSEQMVGPSYPQPMPMLLQVNSKR